MEALKRYIGNNEQMFICLYCNIVVLRWQWTRVVVVVVLRIYIALAIFQPYCDLEAGDNQYLKS